VVFYPEHVVPPRSAASHASHGPQLLPRRSGWPIATTSSVGRAPLSTHQVVPPSHATIRLRSIPMKSWFCLLAIGLLTATADAQFKPTPLSGAWSVTEIKRTGPNAQTMNHPQPGLLIFTGNHYSLMIIETEQPRAEVHAQSTAAELLATWGPFIAASGTYEISGNTLTTRPTVAKNPPVMAPGNVQLNTFKIEGKTLTLTRVRDGNVAVANPTTIILTRVE
jgi:hypothetical protein